VDPVRDAALILLDPGIQWAADVLEIGPLTGVHRVSVDEVKWLDYRVRKRGERTRFTGGIVEAVDATRRIAGITHTNIVIIKPNPNANECLTDGLVWFGAHGDSGSVVVNDDNAVVGHLFATEVPAPGSPAPAKLLRGLALPITDTLKQFSDVEKLSLEVATATADGQVNTVPGVPPTAAPVGAAFPGTTLGTVDVAAQSYPATLSRFASDAAASEAGRRLRDLWLEHHQELLDLVDHRRRVTVAWHRGGGPALLQALIRMSADPTAAMPATINGEPPARRLRQLHAVFHAHASPALRRALDETLAVVPDPAGLTYDQFLAALADPGQARVGGEAP
jgi:hypothetical protein